MRAKRTSRRRTASSPWSATPTATTATNRPKRNSSSSPKRTRCCAIPTSAPPTIATAWQVLAAARAVAVGASARCTSTSPKRSWCSCATSASGGAGASGGGAFESLFGGGQRRDRRRGHDIRVGLKLTLAEVATGTTKTVRIKSLEPCPECEGTGAKPGSQPTQCGTCGGSGEVRHQAQSLFGQFFTVSPCPTCAGEGTVVRDPCHRCGGDGRVKGEKTIQIDVPAGVADHHYLTLRGQGVPGTRNGPRGDLIAVLDIKEDPRFERHGDDLVYDLGITFTQAALGAEIQVPTPFGPTTLRVEPGTQTGMAYRLRAKGLPRLGEGGHGDLHVRIHVWTPTKLTVEQRKLLEKLSEVEDAPPEKESGKFWDTIRRALGQL